VFSEKHAKCENWMDPTKNFICPHCDIALLRTEQTPDSALSKLKRIKPVSWIGLVGFFVMLLLIDRRAGLPPLFPYIAIVFAILVVVIYHWFTDNLPEKTETVDISLERDPKSNVFEFKSKDDSPTQH
jgi:hypothetical protein